MSSAISFDLDHSKTFLSGNNTFNSGKSLRIMLGEFLRIVGKYGPYSWKKDI